jgi:hypothetical protein
MKRIDLRYNFNFSLPVPGSSLEENEWRYISSKELEVKNEKVAKTLQEHKDMNSCASKANKERNEAIVKERDWRELYDRHLLR